MIDIISVGCGVQSSALTIMAGEKDLDAQFGVFCNTGSERPETYEYLHTHLLPYLEGKFKLIILHPDHWDAAVSWYASMGYDVPYSFVKPGSIHEEYFGANFQKRIALHLWYYNDKSLPFKVVRACTDNWKTQPFYRYLHHININTAQIVFGFSYDEIHRMKDNLRQGYTNVYPLIDKKITRSDLEQHFYRDRGLPNPPKSGCFMCPFTRKDQWLHLKQHHKKLFKFAIDLEETAEQDIKKQGQTFYPLNAHKKLRYMFPNQNLKTFLDDKDDDDPFCGESCMT